MERDKRLQVHSEVPFNAETPGYLLLKNAVTETSLFFIREHGAEVPIFDKHEYILTVEWKNKKQSVKLEELLSSRFCKQELMVTLQCAGNRRNELSAYKKVNGVNWNYGAIGNALWGGVFLRDVLMDIVGNEILKQWLLFNTWHVVFEGAENVLESNYYGSSIPLSKALDETGDVLLAWEMNNAPLLPDHGYPLRVIVPGYIGARSVKWLKKIILHEKESENYFQQVDYKILPSHITMDEEAAIMWKLMPAIQETNLQSVIMEPMNGDRIDSLVQRIEIKGFAIGPSGENVIRVEVSLDDGKTWSEAKWISPYQGRWAWRLWACSLSMSKIQRQSNLLESGGTVVITCRAWDEKGQTQPRAVHEIWNYRGLMNNAWHSIQLFIT